METSDLIFAVDSIPAIFAMTKDLSLLREEAKRGCTIVLTTQILSEAEELCDDMLIINHGRQVARGALHS